MKLEIKVAIWTRTDNNEITGFEVITKPEIINKLTKEYISKINKDLQNEGSHKKTEVITLNDTNAELFIHINDQLKNKIEYDKSFIKSIENKLDEVNDLIKELS